MAQKKTSKTTKGGASGSRSGGVRAKNANASGSRSPDARAGVRPQGRTRAGSRSQGSKPQGRNSGGSGQVSGQQRMKTASRTTQTPPLVRREISGILMIALGILLFMGLFFKDSAGFFGDALRALSGGMFGVTAWFLPFLVVGQGLYRVFARSGHPLWNRFFNLMLLMMLISAMFQVGAHPRSDYTAKPLGQLVQTFFREGANTLDTASGQSFLAGGVFGGILGVPLLMVFQRAGATVVLATLGLVVALIVTRISLVDAARSVAVGTAGKIGGMADAARRRRDARAELYEAQTRLMPELNEHAALEGTATGVAARRKGKNGRSDRSGTDPYARMEQMMSTATGVKQEPVPSRDRGPRFLEVTPEPVAQDEWDEEEQGPSMNYPASFVHPDKDMGDLRIGQDGAPTELFDPFTGELAQPGAWADALRQPESPWTQEHPVPGDDPVSREHVLSQEHSFSQDNTDPSSDAFPSSGAFPAETPGSPGSAFPAEENAPLSPDKARGPRKAAGTGMAVAPPGKEPAEPQDMPQKDLASQWENTLSRQEEQRRTGAVTPPKPAGGTEVFLPGTEDDDDRPARPYTPPPVALLTRSREDEQNMRRIRATSEENARKLEATLESFGIGAKVNHISVGPAITRYELQPAPGIKVSRIVNLTDDIALSLASSGVRIEAPIPGKAAIGVEVPNKEVAPISLRSVLESKEFESHPSKLAVALGKDISGENMVVDLAKMPHVLIAGATGSGKSVCINSIVISLLYKAKPEEVKLLMIDPKVVELGVYNGIPHLLIPVVTDPNKAAGALRWAVQEMVTRYKLFADRGVRDLAGYNASVAESGEGMKLPQMVLIIDELADLMMVAPHDVEDSICRLAQMARAAGMHLVIATQRPSVNVITGVIKANVPSRIAFSVSSQVDSRTIIDMAGAEKLLGKGDMLYYPVGFPKPVRVKGCFISDKEVELVVDHVKAQMLVRYDEDIIGSINDSQPSESDTPEEEEADNLLEDAVDALIDSGQASVSFVQRRFKVGYARAGRIIDQMAEKGIISGYEGSKPRRVLITREMWNEMRMQKVLRVAETTRNTSEPASRNATEGASPRLRTAPAEPVRAVPVSESRGADETLTTPAESAFVRRAMADAQERERRNAAYGDVLPDENGDSGEDDAAGSSAWDAEDID